MSIDKKKFDKIMDIIFDVMEYDVERTGYHEQDVHGYIDKTDIERVMKAINEVLEETNVN